MNRNRPVFGIALLVAVVAVMLVPGSARAHCDALDGPVVKAAQKALSTGNVDLVLVWVLKQDEQQIRDAFDRTLAVRKLGGDAMALADMYFFETLVRIHRAGEGAPYTGLKPAGGDMGPAIPLADQVLLSGDVDKLIRMLTDELKQGVNTVFEHAWETRNYADVERGREHVRAYVTYIHFVERAYEAATQPVGGHFPEAATAPEHGHN
jgi:hypothetical protein